MTVESGIIPPARWDWPTSTVDLSGTPNLSIALEQFQKSLSHGQALPSEAPSGAITIRDSDSPVNSLLLGVLNTWRTAKLVSDIQQEAALLPILRTIKTLFSRIPEVEALYQHMSNKVLTVWVFTNNETYSDSLMDTLISQEEAILDNYPQQQFDFIYVPSVTTENYADVIGSDAKLLFQR